MAGEPQKPSAPPPPAGASFWRRVAQLAGVDDEIDAVSAAVIAAQNWAQSKLPPPAALPKIAADLQARQADLDQRKQAQWDAISAPVSRFFGSAPVQQAARHLKEKYYDVPPEVQGLSERLQSTVTERGDTRRAELAAAGLSALDPMFALRDEWLPNLAIGTAADSTSAFGAASNLDLPIGPAAKAVGGVAAHAGMLPGFFSRVERVAAQVPAKGVHPNKLMSLLKSGASQEEVTYRRINDLIAGKGNQLITKAELDAHLAANPAPEIGQTVRGGPNPKRLTTLPEGYSLQLARGHREDGDLVFTLVGPDGVGRVLHSDNRLDAMDEALSQLSAGQPVSLPTKYDSYTLPGGENYRESLTQLRPPESASSVTPGRLSPAEQFDLTGRTGPDLYRGGHWEEPNVVVHARSNERTLAPPPMRALPEIEQIIQDVVGTRRPEHIASGGPQAAVRQGLITHDEAALYGQSRGFTNYPHAPAGPRGRFIEEVQGDWPQQGEQRGYADPVANSAELHDAGATLAQAEIDHAARLQEITGGQLTPGEILFLSQASEPGDTLGQMVARLSERADWAPQISRGDIPGLQARAHTWLEQQMAAGHRSPVSAAWSAMNALRQTEEPVVAARAALRTVKERQGQLVPDMPFKDTWPDLALKQQLLDAAHRQDLDWLGLSGAQTHIDRYGTQRLSWAPEGSGYRVKWEPQVGGDALGEDLGEAALARGLVTNADKYVETPEQLAQLLGTSSEVKAEKAWKRMQASPEGGTYLPRKEGMQAFYDQKLPAKLQKLLKSFGGTVERGDVPTRKTVDVPLTRYRISTAPDGFGSPTYFHHQNYSTADAAEDALADLRESGQSRWGEGAAVQPFEVKSRQEVNADEPAWIARLSPEMKAQIRSKGFPLMSFVPPVAVGGAAAAAAAASQLDPAAAPAETDPAAVPFASPTGGSVTRALTRTGLFGPEPPSSSW